MSYTFPDPSLFCGAWQKCMVAGGGELLSASNRAHGVRMERRRKEDARRRGQLAARLAANDMQVEKRRLLHSSHVDWPQQG